MKAFLSRFIAVALVSAITEAQAQTTSASDSLDLLALSFEELMNVRIVSASKQNETLFEAPVTSFVITRKDIANSGATSIPEALRLAPALIVREMANGSYDVSIRGGKDNLASHQYWNLNTSILAMIDNRIVFNYYSGGTNWQTLPVDMADIERIEIVYGPNSPLYGPNAVDGVINIITRKSRSVNTGYGTASVQVGEDILFSAFGGQKVTDKLEVNVSANHVNRRRFRAAFYDPATSTFITDLREHTDPRISSDPNAYYPNPELGSRHTGMNFNVYFTPKKNTTLLLNSTYNESLGLLGSTLGAISQQFSNNSVSNMIKVITGNFTLQTSILRGRLGTNGNLSEYNYNYVTLDNYADYNLKVNRKLSFRPAIGYQRATIDDMAYTVKVGKRGLFNNKAFMYNYAFSLKTEYTPVKAIRLIGAVRADRFKSPDKTYVSYQGVINYKINAKNILRFLAGRSFAGSFIESTFLNLSIDDPFMKVTVSGNKDLTLLKNTILEVGYRMQVGKASIDVNVFRQSYNNFSTPVTKLVKEPSFEPPQQGETEIVFENIDLESRQTGVTVAATLLFGNVSFKSSLTCQNTYLTDFSPYYRESHPVFYPEYNIKNVSDKESDYAPDLFGGFVLNIPVKKWNVNFSGYYYTRYTLDGLNSLNFETGALAPKDIENISGKFLLNANVGYTLSSQVKAFVNGRNILGQQAREAYGTDAIGTLLFAGVTIEY